MDVIEARQDLDHGAALGLAHLADETAEAVHRPAHGDEQKADVDKERDGEGHVIALGEARAFHIEALGRRGSRTACALDRLHGLFLQLAQLIGRRRHLERQQAVERRGEATERLDSRFRALDGRDLRLFQDRELVDGAYNTSQSGRELRIGAGEGGALGIGERGAVGTFGKVGADLLQLRVRAEGIEAGHGEVELARQALHELVAGAGLGIDDRLVVRHDLGEVAVQRLHVGLHAGDAALDEFGGEREAAGVVLTQLAAGAVAGLRIGARLAGVAFLDSPSRSRRW